ncbi:hypothetical protein [Bacillus cereus]|uniref:hypothetical protein n=1 Tax=Bacillus cereus TaxID=1396 RepID=UPI00397EF09D
MKHLKGFPAFIAGLALGGFVTLLDLFEKLQPYGVDVPGFVKGHPYISGSIVLIVIALLYTFNVKNNKAEEKKQEEIAAAEERKKQEEIARKEAEENAMYERLADAFNEKFPDNMECGPSNIGSLYSDLFLTNKLAIAYSKRVMIELDKRGLAKLEIDRSGNYRLRKIKK